MALQNFVSKVTTVSAAWLNSVDVLLDTVFATPTTKALARTALTSDAALEIANGGTGNRTGLPTFPQTAIETTAGATAVNLSYPSPGYGVLNVLRYGTNTTPGTTDMTAAIQACVNVCGLSGDTCFIPPGTYKATADITPSVGVQFLQGGNGPFAHDIRGAGREQTIIQFTAGTNGLYYNGVSGYKLTGKISDLTIDGTTALPTALTFANCDMPHAERMIIRRTTGRAVFFNTTIMGRFAEMYITGCGSGAQAVVEVLNSTTWTWVQSYLSTNASAVAGLRVDKSNNTQLFGGAIESSGIPMQVGSLADAVTGCVGGLIHGVDFEKPTDHYLEFGYGCSGAAFVSAWDIRSCTGYPSGTALVNYAVKMNACSGIRFGNCNWAMAGASIASYWLEGVTNTGVVIEAHPNLYGFTFPWVMQNGAQIASATPLVDFTQKDTLGDVGLPQTGTITGATASNAVAAQGGIYERLLVNNGGATVMTALTGGKRGMRLYMLSVNGNTTLTHAPATPNSWNLKAAVNLLMVANTWYAFMFDGTAWGQL